MHAATPRARQRRPPVQPAPGAGQERPRPAVAGPATPAGSKAGAFRWPAATCSASTLQRLLRSGSGSLSVLGQRSVTRTVITNGHDSRSPPRPLVPPRDDVTLDTSTVTPRRVTLRSFAINQHRAAGRTDIAVALREMALAPSSDPESARGPADQRRSKIIRLRDRPASDPPRVTQVSGKWCSKKGCSPVTGGTGREERCGSGSQIEFTAFRGEPTRSDQSAGQLQPVRSGVDRHGP